MKKMDKIIHRDFDGHLEKELKDMTPKEKLDYIWQMIELKNYLAKNAKKVKQT